MFANFGVSKGGGFSVAAPGHEKRKGGKDLLKEKR